MSISALDMEDITGLWRSLNRWSSTLFLVGGVLALIFAARKPVQILMDTGYGNVGFLFLSGYLLAFIGLFGLYPQLARQKRWLAGVGAVGACLGMVGFAGSVFVIGMDLAGFFPENPPVWLNTVPLSIIGMIVGYLAFGVASLRSDTYARLLGLLLLVPGLLFGFSVIVDLAPGFDQWRFLFGVGQAVSFLAIGYVLRTQGREASRSSERDWSAS